jgi:hypothetical protein
VLAAGETFHGDLQLAQFGPAALEAALTWELATVAGEVVRSGQAAPRRWATGALHDAGPVAIDTAGLAAAVRYRLTVALADTPYSNAWSLWLFEPMAATPPLPVAEALDEAAMARLAAGETVVLMPEPASLKPNAALGHTTVFWNTLWTGGQPPHTLGLLVDTGHPLFARFPSDTHADWHWWELTYARRAFDIEGAGFRPIVRVIDDWNENRDLVLVAEAAVGPGRLVLCAIDLANDLDHRPVARAFRNALAAALAQPSPNLPDVEAAALRAWWQRVTV